MIRNETFRDGVVVAAEIIDLDAGTVTVVRDGKTTEYRPLTADEIEQYTPAEPAPSVEDRLAAVEAENATLRQALIDAAVIDQRALDTAREAVIEPGDSKRR